MYTTLVRNFTRLTLLGAALLLGACNTLEPGEDEFRDAAVDASAAGKTLAMSFSQGKDWDAAIAAPSAPALTLSAQAGLLGKSAALPKLAKRAEQSGAGLEFKIDLEDTARGYVTLTASAVNALQSVHDTVVARWDEQARDDLTDNENVIRYKHVVTNALGRTEILEISDADGDGIVTPAAGADNQARFVFTVVQQGVAEKADLVIGAGPDGDFDGEADNTVHRAEWTRTRGGKEIARGEFLDADGDGLVGDNARTCVTLVKWFEIDPADRPLVKKQTAEARLRVFANKAGDEPVSFAFTEELKTGRVNSLSIRNRHGESEIIKGDTLWVTLATAKAADDDTLRHADLVFVMNPGEDLKSESDDVCYAIHVKTGKKRGFERSAEFHFIAGEPVPHGQDPESGTFEGRATYANGKSASLEGSFSPEGFKAEFTGPEGNTVTVEFTLSGDVV